VNGSQFFIYYSINTAPRTHCLSRCDESTAGACADPAAWSSVVLPTQSDALEFQLDLTGAQALLTADDNEGDLLLLGCDLSSGCRSASDWRGPITIATGNQYGRTALLDSAGEVALLGIGTGYNLQAFFCADTNDCTAGTNWSAGEIIDPNSGAGGLDFMSTSTGLTALRGVNDTIKQGYCTGAACQTTAWTWQTIATFAQPPQAIHAATVPGATRLISSPT
jgi:hypothetical protein